MGHPFDPTVGGYAAGARSINFSPFKHGFEFVKSGAYASLFLLGSDNTVNVFTRWLLMERDEVAKRTAIHKLTVEGKNAIVRSLIFGELRPLNRHRDPFYISTDEVYIPIDTVSNAQRRGGRVEIGKPFQLGEFSTESEVTRLETAIATQLPGILPDGKLFSYYSWIEYIHNAALEEQAARLKQLGDAGTAHPELHLELGPFTPQSN